MQNNVAFHIIICISAESQFLKRPSLLQCTLLRAIILMLWNFTLLEEKHLLVRIEWNTVGKVESLLTFVKLNEQMVGSKATTYKYQI